MKKLLPLAVALHCKSGTRVANHQIYSLDVSESESISSIILMMVTAYNPLDIRYPKNITQKRTSSSGRIFFIVAGFYSTTKAKAKGS